eukprot:13224.XXX_574452_574613_1 [CDS] Oithona nana genome sequencing.
MELDLHKILELLQPQWVLILGHNYTQHLSLLGSYTQYMYQIRIKGATFLEHQC